jgi:hypothetical protein
MVVGQFKKYAGRFKKWEAPRAASARENPGALILQIRICGTNPGHHSRPITTANSSVLVGVGEIMK